MSTATITSKGQLTLPKDVRTAMGVRAGDRVTFVRMDDGRFAVVPAKRPIQELAGLLKHRARPDGPVSIEAMNEDIMQAVAERDARSKSGR